MCVCVTVRNYRRWWIGCVQECAKWPQFFFLLLWRSLSLMLLLFYRTKTLADWRFHFSSELPSNSRKKFCCLPAHLPKQKSKEKYGSPSQADSEKVSNGIGTTDILTKGENKKKPFYLHTAQQMILIKIWLRWLKAEEHLEYIVVLLPGGCLLN